MKRLKLFILIVSALPALMGCGRKEIANPIQNSAEVAAKLIDAMDSAKAVVDEFKGGGLSEAESERRLNQLQREAEPLWPMYFELSLKAREAGEDPDQLHALGEKPLQERMALEMKMATSKSSLQTLLQDMTGGDELPAKMEECLRVIADWPAFTITVMEGEELRDSEARGIERSTKTAEGGDAQEQYRTGDSYSSDGNYEEAVNWFRKSANQGFHPAMIKLGELYFFGDGTPENRPLGYAWLLIASTSDEERWAKDAERILDVYSNHPQLERKMSAEEISEAKELAKGLSDKLPKN